MALTKEQLAARKVALRETDVVLRDIPGFPRYAASVDGRIWSWGGRSNANLCGKWLRGRPTQDGYLVVAIYTDDGRVDERIHRLVALTWIGPKPERDSEVNHRNGIKTDNSLGNLEWCSRSHNQRHAWATGLKKVTDKQRAALTLGPKARAVNHAH